VNVSVTWHNATADYGNTINPKKTKNQPDVEIINSDPSYLSHGKKAPQLTLAMTDPDAPSRDNPEWSEICHWIVTDVGLSQPDNEYEHDEGDSRSVKKRMIDVMPFKPPGPPPRTGKHRYVFVALVPKNGTTDELDLRKPGDRQHWGFKHERDGLRMWAEEMGLKAIGKSSSPQTNELLILSDAGANFMYAQNDEQ
jgi:phosphatidylethanolamine-binding protein